MSRGLDVEVRKATASDHQRVFEVHRSSVLAGLSHIFPPDKYPFPEDAERRKWFEYFESADHMVLIAERDGSAVGVAVIADDLLERFFVVSEQWGKGVADALHDEAIELMRSRGLPKCRLWVLDENQRARRFYEKRGWRQDGEERVSNFPPHPLSLGYTKSLA